MPVLISSPQSEMDIVIPLAERLRQDGGEVRCYLEVDDSDLRNSGCKIAVGALDDEITLAGALTNVHTFIPLMPASGRWPDATGSMKILHYAKAAAAAANSVRVEQTVLVVESTTDPTTASVFDDIESEFQGLEPLCVLEVGAIDRLASGTSPVARSDLISVEELVSLLALIDDRESTHGRFKAGSVREELKA